MFQIQNRRYIGCKYRLLPFIEEVIEKHCPGCQTFADLFGGTGVVAYCFNDRYRIIINDILLCNYFVYQAFLSPLECSMNTLSAIVERFNTMSCGKENYYSVNFANTYLNAMNMRKIGQIRDEIDILHGKGIINEREKAILISSLLYAVDKIANTVGHYDAWRKHAAQTREIVLQLPDIQNNHNAANEIYREDANELARRIKSDIVYVDPPYNSRQYCDAYHFLENIAANQKPPVGGIARKMDRRGLKSAWCLAAAPNKLRKLVEDIDARYIIISYNNTGASMNGRSNARLSDNEIISCLRNKGKLHIYERKFNAFSAGKTRTEGHTERLFVCEAAR